MMENQTPLVVNSEMQDYLRSSSKWSVFLSILGFIGAGIMVMLGIFMTVLGGSMSAMSNPVLPTKIMPFLGVFYLLFAIVYVLPSLYLFQFANKTKKSLETNDQDLLTQGVKNLKLCFKTLGILSIVCIVLTFVGYAFLIAFFVSKGLF